MDPDMAGVGPGHNYEDPDVAGTGPGRNHEDPDVAGAGPGRNHEDPDVAGEGPGRNREGLGTARGPGVMLSCGPYHGPKSRGQKTWKSKLRILGPPPLGDAVVDQGLAEKLAGCYFLGGLALPICENSRVQIGVRFWFQFWFVFGSVSGTRCKEF